MSHQPQTGKLDVTLHLWIQVTALIARCQNDGVPAHWVPAERQLEAAWVWRPPLLVLAKRLHRVLLVHLLLVGWAARPPLPVLCWRPRLVAGTPHAAGR